MADADEPAVLLERAHRTRDELMAPYRVDGIDLTVRSSIGITLVSKEDQKASDVLRRADVAMFEAKAARAGALMYDRSRDGYTRERLEVADQLRHAIANQELRLWYQPQVSAESWQLQGLEALIRWHHPVRGVLSPADFLDEARRSGLMAALTDSVMQQAVADASGFVEAGLTVSVSFNCGPPELLGTTLLPRLYEAIDAAGIPPETIVVELTEDSFANDPELAKEALLGMRHHHVQASIDDYGTGFSSLAYLRDLPVQELKIDRSFVRTLGTDNRSRAIVDSTSTLAHAIGLRLVAEGVEDEATATDLSSLGVDLLQGYFISRPMPADDVIGWAAGWSTSPAHRENTDRELVPRQGSRL